MQSDYLHQNEMKFSATIVIIFATLIHRSSCNFFDTTSQEKAVPLPIRPLIPLSPSFTDTVTQEIVDPLATRLLSSLSSRSTDTTTQEKAVPLPIRPLISLSPSFTGTITQENVAPLPPGLLSSLSSRSTGEKYPWRSGRQLRPCAAADLAALNTAIQGALDASLPSIDLSGALDAYIKATLDAIEAEVIATGKAVPPGKLDEIFETALLTFTMSGFDVNNLIASLEASIISAITANLPCDCTVDSAALLASVNDYLQNAFTTSLNAQITASFSAIDIETKVNDLIVNGMYPNIRNEYNNKFAPIENQYIKYFRTNLEGTVTTITTSLTTQIQTALTTSFNSGAIKAALDAAIAACSPKTTTVTETVTITPPTTTVTVTPPTTTVTVTPPTTTVTIPPTTTVTITPPTTTVTIPPTTTVTVTPPTTTVTVTPPTTTVTISPTTTVTITPSTTTVTATPSTTTNSPPTAGPGGAGLAGLLNALLIQFGNGGDVPFGLVNAFLAQIGTGGAGLFGGFNALVSEIGIYALALAQAFFQLIFIIIKPFINVLSQINYILFYFLPASLYYLLSLVPEPFFRNLEQRYPNLDYLRN